MSAVLIEDDARGDHGFDRHRWRMEVEARWTELGVFGIARNRNGFLVRCPTCRKLHALRSNILENRAFRRY